jgi:hypothetical protein
MHIQQIVTAENVVIAAAYLGISYTILSGLTRMDQLRTNRLGTATGLIFRRVRCTTAGTASTCCCH